MISILDFALLLPWVLIAFLCWLLYHLLRQHGRALLAQDELRERLAAAERTLQELAGQVATQASAPAGLPPQPQPAPAPQGLALGSQAPDFALPDLDGKPRRLGDFLGQPLLVVFFNTGCGFCQQMAPGLGQLPANAPRVLLISRGDAAEHRRLAKEHNWRADVVLEPSWEVATAYGVSGTPMGYLLDARGHVASSLAVGSDAVLAMTRVAPPDGKANGTANGSPADLTAAGLRAKEQATTERARAAGLAVRESTIAREGLPAGIQAPDFRLPDLAGHERTLAEFRGKRVLLVFSDPDCGPCQALAPELVQLELAADDLRVVMVSRGDREANRAKAAEFGFPFPVLLQRQWEVSRSYAKFATPVGYLIDEQGVIAQDVAVGAEAILQLAAGARA